MEKNTGINADKVKKWGVIIVLAIETVITLGLAKARMNQGNIQFCYRDEDLLLSGPEMESVPGFYCQGDMGRDVFIQTPAMVLEKGIYTVTVDYELEGIARSMKNGADAINMSNGSGSMTYDIFVSDSREPVYIQNRMGYEAQGSDYLLIHSIRVARSDADIRNYVFKLICTCMAFDLLFIVIWKRKELSLCGGVMRQKKGLSEAVS